MLNNRRSAHCLEQLTEHSEISLVHLDFQNNAVWQYISLCKNEAIDKNVRK